MTATENAYFSIYSQRIYVEWTAATMAMHIGCSASTARRALKALAASSDVYADKTRLPHKYIG